MTISRFLFLGIFVFSCLSIFGQSDNIHLNQVGYFTNGPKKAIAIDCPDSTFEIWKDDYSEKVYSGKFVTRPAWGASGETNIKLADFSDFHAIGKFILFAGIQKSFPFTISGNALDEVTKGQMKYYYFNRASMPLLEKYAGYWARLAGHLNTNVLAYENSNRSFSMPGGWYDAGDYGLYMVTASLAVNQILMSYEQFPDYWNKTEWNIPESGNGVPDILDEVKYELKWMYKMKDTLDDGVYYKATSLSFAGEVLPNSDNSQIYCMVKNATSGYDYAGSFAIASRIYKNFETQFPGFSDSCLNAAKEAWTWSIANETKRPSCTNPSDVTTGAYTDNVSDKLYDNKVNAGVELFITTGDSSYLKPVLSVAQNGFVNGEASWSDKRPVACLDLALHGDIISKEKVIEYANSQLDFQKDNGYMVNIGNVNSDFKWGSNRRISNRGSVMMGAYILTKDQKYLTGVVNTMDYILGRNATNYSFITGFGSKQCMDPHHRISYADLITAPQPGLPIEGSIDGNLSCAPLLVSTFSAKNFNDIYCSYSTSEMSIDQGSPHVFNFAGLMTYLQDKVNVSIISPSHDTLIANGQDIEIKVDANSSVGTISKVEFYKGTTLLNTDVNTPFSYTLTNSIDSVYTIRAIAYDDANNSSEASIKITVGNIYPTIVVKKPAFKSYYAPGSDVKLEATVSDADNAIQSIKLFLNNSLVNESTQTSINYIFKNLPEGESIIKIIATDIKGASTSKEIPVIVACVNILNNSEFDDYLAYWTLDYSSPGSAKMTITNSASLSGKNAMGLNITNSGTLNSSIQVYQPIAIDSGRTYNIVYLGKATSKRTIDLVIKNGINTLYTVTDSLHETPDYYIHSFKSDITTAKAKLYFNAGKQPKATINLDKIEMNECTPESKLVIITFPENTLALNLGDTFMAKIIYIPKLDTNKVITWTSSSSGIASINQQGKIKTYNAGTTTIKASVEVDNITYSCQMVLTVSISAINEEARKLFAIQTTSDQIIVNAIEPLTNYQIIDMDGKLISSKEINQSEFSINTGLLSSGIYFLKVQNNKNETGFARFVKN